MLRPWLDDADFRRDYLTATAYQLNIDAVLPKAAANRAGVLAKRPLANAAWKDPDRQPGMYKSYASTYTQRLAKMGLDPAELGFPGPPETVWPELALRFTLGQPDVHCAIIGTTNPEFISADGVQVGPEHREKALAGALQAATNLQAA